MKSEVKSYYSQEQGDSASTSLFIGDPGVAPYCRKPLWERGNPPSPRLPSGHGADKLQDKFVRRLASNFICDHKMLWFFQRSITICLNVQHRTFNAEHRMKCFRNWTLNVGRSMFDVHIRPSFNMHHLGAPQGRS